MTRQVNLNAGAMHGYIYFLSRAMWEYVTEQDPDFSFFADRTVYLVDQKC